MPKSFETLEWYGPGWYASQTRVNGRTYTHWFAEPEADQENAERMARWSDYHNIRLLTDKPGCNTRRTVWDHTN
jgi:hypothetical protein